MDLTIHLYNRLVCSLVMGLALLAPAAYAESLVLNTANTYPRTAPDGSGFQDLIIKEAFRRIGVAVRIVQLPSERSLLNADAGIDDGVFVRVEGLSSRYPHLQMVPESISAFEFAVFTRNPRLAVRDWQSLKPYHVGIITGWKILEAKIVGTRSLVMANNDESLFQLLLSDRVDLVVFDRVQGRAYLQKRNIRSVRILTPLLAKKDMFLYLHERHRGLIPPLTKALREMKADGSYQKLIDSVIVESQ